MLENNEQRTTNNEQRNLGRRGFNKGKTSGRNLYAVVLAGGSGTRFWPRSRHARPKTALAINGRKTLIQETMARLSPVVPLNRVFIITTKAQKKLISRQIPHIKARNVIEEPEGKDTAAAIGLGAILVAKRDPEGVIISMPSDHWIGEPKKFHRIVKRAVGAAKNGSLVTIGIKPRYAATRYGYIKVKRKKEKGKRQELETRNQKPETRLFEVERFVEKPDQRRATRFVNSGGYFWNSGIFIWKVSAILGALRAHMPALYKKLMWILDNIGKQPLDVLLKRAYATLEKISIDYGVMEKARSVKMVVADFLWDDLGSWVSLSNLFAKDLYGNVILSRHLGVDTHNSIIVGDKKHLIGTCGIRNLVIVHTDDATLVAPQNKAEEIKVLVKRLKENKYLKDFS